MMATQEPIFDKREQLDKIRQVLLPGEEIDAVYDLKGAQTGFIGITDRRLIIYDRSFLGNRRAIVSVPHINVIAVGSEDEGNLLSLPGFETSKLTVQTAVGHFTLEFRGHDKAYEAYRLILSRIL
jgi:hypothetical protein